MSSKDQVVLARKYRPSQLTELIGQETLVAAINNSILRKKMHHAYLLTGIRGIGKTTTARIISKLVNCENLFREGEVAKSCDKCSNCLSVQKANHPDVVEIDAASNTSVEGIRDIISNAQYKPIQGVYKVFIIDEVHMLSKSAFNALLKILEEPPANIMFIFATTEINKVPLTIVSRCQRFDLRRLAITEVQDLLSNVAQLENFQFEISAIKFIATKSEGSARDALSLLDQAAAISGGGIISLEIVKEMTGSVDIIKIVDLVELIADKNVAASIDLLNDLYLSSKSLIDFFEDAADLCNFLTKILLTSNYEDPKFEFFKERLSDVSSKFSVASLTVIWQIFTNSLIEAKHSHNLLRHFEMSVIKSIYSNNILSIKQEAINENSSSLKECPRQE